MWYMGWNRVESFEGGSAVTLYALVLPELVVEALNIGCGIIGGSFRKVE